MTNGTGSPGGDLEELAGEREPLFADSSSAVGFFSPHHLSHNQIQEMEKLTERTMSGVEDLSELAERHINTRENVDRVWKGLHERLGEMTEEADKVILFGVFPPPIRAKFLRWSTGRTPTNVHLLESFSSRQKTGGRGPDFNHITWVETGKFNLKFPSS